MILIFIYLFVMDQLVHRFLCTNLAPHRGPVMGTVRFTVCVCVSVCNLFGNSPRFQLSYILSQPHSRSFFTFHKCFSDHCGTSHEVLYYSTSSSSSGGTIGT